MKNIYAFENSILIPKRSVKPRKQGLTMVMDRGDLGPQGVQDLFNRGGEYIDMLKFGWTTMRLIPMDITRQKIELCKNFDVVPCPGGIALEAAVMYNKVTQFLEEAKDIGFAAIEVSDSIINMASIDLKVDLIRVAKSYDFLVHAEVGKKTPEESLSIARTVDEINKCLDAGASKVILEAYELEALRGKEEQKSSTTLLEIAHRVGVGNIIFEAKEQPLQVWCIEKFGPEVNLGNILPADLISLETMRRGVHWPTGFGKIFAPEF
jgi:phosphosulfolactate synthase